MSKIDFSKSGFGTTLIHAGQEADLQYRSLAVPIYQTSTFCFDDLEQAIETAEGKQQGYMYTRGGNPTTAVLETKLAIMEKAEDCVVTASGMGAVGAVFMGLLKTGDHMISAKCIYSSTDVVLRNTLIKFGVEISFVDTTDMNEVKKAFKENTKLVFFETLSNPTNLLTDIEAISKLAHEKGAKVVVDNTFTPPPITYPLELGADIVVHSCTKYINGHGDVLLGAALGNSEDIAIIRKTAASKVCGATSSPFNSFLTIRGLQTLELRIERHCENANALAHFLEKSPYVKKVYYPGLEKNGQYGLAKSIMNGKYGGMVTFELKEGINGMSGIEACKKLLDNLKIAKIAVSLGDPATPIQHPQTMTHSAVAKDDKAAAGISDSMIRLSAGLENTEDLIDDFENAFKSF